MSLSQRRNQDGEDVEAIEEVAAELSAPDVFEEVPIGGRNHSDIGAEGRCTSEPLELSFLKHSQQLRLQLERNIPDLVEEDRPAGSPARTVRSVVQSRR